MRICRAPPAPPCPVLTGTATSSDRDEPHGDVISITVASLGARFGAQGCYFYPHDPAGFWLSPASDRATSQMWSRHVFMAVAMMHHGTHEIHNSACHSYP